MSATFEAMENVGIEVGGKASAGAACGAMEGAWATLLLASLSTGFEAEELQDGSYGDGGTHRSEIDGRSIGS